MGMFDYVSFKCPSCGHTTEDQSKAAGCGLNYYHIGLEDNEDMIAAPLEIMAEAESYGLTCSGCNFRFRPVVDFSFKMVPWG